MHELSIAQNIIEIVEETAKKQNAKCVEEVIIDVGLVSGVVPETLEFVMDVVTKDTLVENAKIIINIIEAKAKCSNCSNEFKLDDIFGMCPKCNSLQFDIISGKELRVKSIKIK